MNFGGHARAGNVRWAEAALFAATGVVGALVGSTISKEIDGKRLILFFAGMMIVIGIAMLRPRKGEGRVAVPLTVKAGARVGTVGLLVGLLSGFFGIGGGFLIVPGLILATGMPMINAIGTSLFAVGTFGLATALNYAASGFVDWIVAAEFIGGGVVGGYLGMRAACHVAAQRSTLNRPFAGLVFVVAFYIIWRSRRRMSAGSNMEETRMSPDLDLSIHPIVTPFFDKETNTISYVVRDPNSTSCAVIDSVLDFDYAAGHISYRPADAMIAFIREQGLTLEWLIETHVHADHLSAAPYIQSALGGKIGIGEQITTVQDRFGKVFNEGTEFQRDGSQFDRLFADGDTYEIGSMRALALHTPGHTPACMTHVVGDAAFVGDTLFMPDGGTARADFPGGDARQLYRSIKLVLSLPAEMRLFICHDYGPNGREIKWETTVGDERAHNVHVRDGISEDEFVRIRTERDATLAMPKLIIPSIQINMRGGQLPPPDEEQRRFLKVPLNSLKQDDQTGDLGG